MAVQLCEVLNGCIVVPSLVMPHSSWRREKGSGDTAIPNICLA